MAAGHQDADAYPIWLIWYRNQLVIERQNALIVTGAVVLQAALSTTAMTSDGGRAALNRFQKLIGELSNES